MTNEAADAFVSLGCLFLDELKLFIGYVILVNGSVELTFDFGSFRRLPDL